MMRRPQFSLRALLVATLIVAAFFGGMALQFRLDAPVITTGQIIDPSERTRIHSIQLRDGTRWYCQRAVKSSQRGRNQKQPFYVQRSARLVFINIPDVDGGRAWRTLWKWRTFRQFNSYMPQNGRSGASRVN